MKVVEIEEGEIFRAGEMVVTAVEVDHYPVYAAQLIHAKQLWRKIALGL